MFDWLVSLNELFTAIHKSNAGLVPENTTD